MPELPEVETMVRALRSRIVGGVVGRIEVDSKFLDDATPRKLRSALTGLSVAQILRRGKYVRFDFEAGHRSKPGRKPASLVVHLKMTGRYFVTGAGNATTPDRARLAITLEGPGRRRIFGLKDTRRLARARLSTGRVAPGWPESLKLGPDALEEAPDAASLAARLSGRRAIKVALLDQARLAGVGNIYASEVLNRTRIHPGRKADTLTAAEWKKLAGEIPRLLQWSLDRWCTASSDVDAASEGYGDFKGQLRVYDREGKKCRRCRGEILRIVQAARATFYCPECQV